MRYRLTSWIERLGRWVLAAVFLYAALSKILDPSGFASDISHYALVPNAAVNILAITLPWIEAVCALALISGFAADGAVILVNLMLLVFLGAMSQAFFRGLDINCGCFGHSDAGEIILIPIARDALFFSIAVCTLWLRIKMARDI